MIMLAGMEVSSSAHFESRDLWAVNDGNQSIPLASKQSEFCPGTSPPKKGETSRQPKKM
jgi:hypothetical protein